MTTMSINVEPAANQDAIERAQAAMGGLIFSSDLGPTVSNEQPKIAWGEVEKEEEGRGNFTKTKESRDSRQSSSDLPPTNCNQFHVFFVQVVIALAFLAFCITMLVKDTQTQKQGIYLPLLSACIGIWFPAPSQKQMSTDNRHVVGLLAQILIAATVMGFCMFMLLRGESEAMYLSLMSACMTYWMTSPQQSKDFGRATRISAISDV